MFQPPIRCFYLPAFFSLFCFCCAFADLRPIDVTTVPDSPWALLPDAESPVIIGFDTEMEKSTVERAVQVYSPDGIADGDMRWKGNALHFNPSAPWKPGIRYALKVSGTVAASDRRETVLAMDIPFYAVSRPVLPFVKSFRPFDGASVGIHGLGETADSAVLELDFSHPMDRRSAESSLRFDIPGGKIIEWLDDDRIMRIRSDAPLNPWVIYRWSMPDKALSRDGAPLAKEFSGRFITDLEQEFIRVIRVVPLLPPEPFADSPDSGLWGSWVPAGLNLEQGPGAGHGIGVEFSKPPDSDSLRRVFSFAPSLPGRVEILSPVTAVYIPLKDPEPETVYSLRISGALKDSEGLKMGDDYTVNFRADIPFLRVVAFSSSGGDGAQTVSDSGGLFPVTVNAGGIIQFALHFSLPFDTGNPAVMEECAFRISLRTFFPGTLPPVSLRSARWIGSDRLLLQWEGPECGDEPHYYRLIIPGGRNGVHNGLGSYMKDDLVLYLEAEE